MTTKTNSLGLEFASAPPLKNILFSKWLTRVKDFRAFVQATGYDATQDMRSLKTDGWKPHGDTWEHPGFQQTDVHPVCGVSWQDAQAFCEWLTEKERRSGRLPAGWTYRLPTDAEWSAAAGLTEETGRSPKEMNAKIPDVYPWGNTWPPQHGDGNFAGEESKTPDTRPNWAMLAGYNDGYPRTSPVGSFKPNPFGLYDMAGNLWEWCADPYSPEDTTRVLRGGSWCNTLPAHLLSSFRYSREPVCRDDDFGFRLVIETTR